ncbi:MAG: hypothetical protein NZT61_06795 [Deltaproteobacteria bacterium]|nr:hypothetical protein [Deltaproteobacteria bacterium]MCX7953073.1 hypothetical protein [Deltaproteobacteria bacterium]
MYSPLKKFDKVTRFSRKACHNLGRLLRASVSKAFELGMSPSEVYHKKTEALGNIAAEDHLQQLTHRLQRVFVIFSRVKNNPWPVSYSVKLLNYGLSLSSEQREKYEILGRALILGSYLSAIIMAKTPLIGLSVLAAGILFGRALMFVATSGQLNDWMKYAVHLLGNGTPKDFKTLSEFQIAVKQAFQRQIRLGNFNERQKMLLMGWFDTTFKL